MPSAGLMRSRQRLTVSSFDARMYLPITEKELEIILEAIKYKNPELYNKLWAHKVNNNHK